MKNIFIFGIIVLLVGIFWFRFTSFSSPGNQQVSTQQNSSTQNATNEVPQTAIIAGNLDTPWAIAILPDNGMLVTERAGRVRLVGSDGVLQPEPIATLPQVQEIGEGGLLGIALHPNFSSDNYVYLYYTYSSSGNNTLNKVVRMTYANGRLSDEQVIVDQIPGAPNHNGGRIKFGPDNNLYITTGDAQEPSLAQDRNSLAGKILRVTDQGKPAPDNPFDNLIYSYGHRNPQGIAWDHIDRLWEVEHGPNAQDEFNLIEAGKNYGWPTIQGDQTEEGMEIPKLNSGSDTWAPAGAVILGNKLFFGGLRGQALYEVDTDGSQINLKEHFKNQFGRIREVILGPDNMLYITTSNRDGRGSPDPADDKIIRINPGKL